MSCSSFSSSLSGYVSQAESIANRLDFFEAVPDVEVRVRLEGDVSRMDRLWWDLYADASAAGRDGVDAYRAATIVRDALAQAVDAWDEDANLSPWRSCRDRVRDVLASMRASCDGIRVVDAPSAAAIGPPVSPVSRSHTQSEKEKGGKVRRSKSRRLSGPIGRPSKDCDKQLRRLMKDVADEIRAEGLNPAKELPSRVYSQTSESLRQMLEERLNVVIGESTIRSCDLWDKWRPYREGQGKSPPAGFETDRGTVESRSVSTGGVKRSAEERRADEQATAWARANGHSLDDV